jgi:hypothetical protein
MKSLVAALSLLAAPAVAWAGDGSLPTALAQDPSEERQEPAWPGPVMNYLYQHSQLELGFLYTHWDRDLDLENDLGFYLRYGVKMAYGVSIQMTYRHYDYENSDIPGSQEEHVLLRGLLGGLALQVPLTPDFTFSAGGGAGFMRWESHGLGLSDDVGPIVSGEAALSTRLHEVLRLRAGVALDFTSTDLRGGSRENTLAVSWLFGFELGF